MKKIFISFGAGGSTFHEAVERICLQAKESKVFDEVFGYTEQDLKIDEVFWSKHSDFVSKNKRGYGYWLWKPYLILKNLKAMNVGDVLVYCDCGCEINVRAKEKLQLLIDKLNKEPIICAMNNHFDRPYVKNDLYVFLNLQPDSEVFKTPQLQASVIIVKKTQESMSFFESFYRICSENYNLIDDTPSVTPNSTDFKEHRHDQAVLSLLAKKTDLFQYDSGEYILSSFKFPMYNTLLKYPIVIMKNRTGNSSLASLFYIRLFATVKCCSIVSRIKSIFKK